MLLTNDLQTPPIRSRTKPPRIAKIAEILGLVEEKGKNKDWLLDEIKRYKISIKVSPTTNSYEILKNCPDKFLNKILKNLKDEEFEIEEVKTLSKTLHWFFTDIVGSSNPKLSTKTQARKIIMLIKLIQKTQTFREINKKNAIFHHAGDGVAIGFSESPESPVRLAIELHKLLNKYNKTKSEKEKIYVRVGIDTGPVYFIKDVEEKEAIWGPGIITTKRVMDLCDSNQIFTSRRLGDDVSNLSPEYKAIMHTIGEYEIKHGEKLFLYNIYGKGFGNKKTPIQNKIVDKSNEEKPNYEFNKVELKLDVTNPKTMMTHHTWIWDVKNISTNPLHQILYDIGGDTSKNLEDLNLNIYDGNGNQIKEYSVEVNKEHEKKINVNLRKPLKKNKNTVLIIEYDWEEPYRSFEYTFSGKCKKMIYHFTISKQIPIKHRILEVASNGAKKRAEPNPQIKYLKDKTFISWESDKKNSIKDKDTFEFQW